MNFGKYQFGFADAEKEYSRVPTLFEEAFFDSDGIINKLINSYHFMLIGRKGVGKSAFSAKIQSISNTSSNIHAYPIQLNDFEFSTFSKTGIDSDVIGTRKYKTTWDFILLLIIYKFMFNELNITENDEFTNLLSLIDVLGFPVDVEYKKDITKLSKLKVGNDVVAFDLEFEKEFGTRPSTYLERISTLTEKMIDVLNHIYFNDQKIMVLIDGVDDILRFKKHQTEVLASLIRSIDYINDKFIRSNQPVKIILFIREDIIANMTDPDLNKIKRDGSILLNWSNRLQDLKSLVNLRFKFSGVNENILTDYWERLFPRRIKGKSSWDHVLEHTLYKPRDLLQYLKSCQDLYPEKQSLSYSEMQEVLKTYSKDYFIEEMKNEITGFIDDKLIILLPTVFRKLGQRSFKISEFKKIIDEQNINKKIEESDIKTLLLSLFDSGYVGQLIKSGRDNKESVVFKYRNTTANIDYHQKFIIHKGLHSGLGVRL
jgi:hypothetical protein